jgi:hypothetical protein
MPNPQGDYIKIALLFALVFISLVYITTTGIIYG